ncbi:hypothetical protein [Gordonia tangerina]|uniref:Nucleoside 2-deoxyribosyltransferase n=1 Tax=Gordonia tangerina TaxID=2911060 RepID=A0ABS9DS48_9ACTN|nr:hypothetical protein [Gordonia tangerina]MCF3940623.1 hypothetical protein [Gordonia tangerina]
MTTPSDDVTPIEVFVASPIGSPNTPGYTQAKKVLKFIVKKALTEPEWTVTRADDDQAPDSITQKVVGRIIRADLVVVDITDHNPNVFYELAIAHCFKRPVVIIAAQGTTSPFDVVDQTRIDYDLTDPESVDTAQARLLTAAKLALEKPDSLVTPLSTYEAVTATAERLETGDSSEFADVLGTLSDRIGRMETLLELYVKPQPRSRTTRTKVPVRLVGAAGSDIRTPLVDAADAVTRVQGIHDPSRRLDILLPIRAGLDQLVAGDEASREVLDMVKLRVENELETAGEELREKNEGVQ